MNLWALPANSELKLYSKMGPEGRGDRCRTQVLSCYSVSGTVLDTLTPLTLPRPTLEIKICSSAKSRGCSTNQNRLDSQGCLRVSPAFSPSWSSWRAVWKDLGCQTVLNSTTMMSPKHTFKSRLHLSAQGGNGRLRVCQAFFLGVEVRVPTHVK